MIAYYSGIGSLIVCLIITLGFCFLYFNRFPRKSVTDLVRIFNKVRKSFFVFIMVSASISTYFALTNTPYPQIRSAAISVDRHITVIGQKWLWHFHEGPYSDDALNSSVTEKIILPMNKQIEFHVTAREVNHGFGLYNSSGKLMAQTQAMPGHVHRLLVSFKEPGVYRILCLEYCGLGHHVMQESFIVK
jgi:cytochrome c oxidase subunit 2